MGIFTKRKVLANEELTFNYNVDRYGHDAQECFCGEPNCVGFIGGKTQTDIAGMDDLYLDGEAGDFSQAHEGSLTSIPLQLSVSLLPLMPLGSKARRRRNRAS